ncbi:ferroxidase fet3 [Coemansia sp. RSA 2320]|nr:ferroxidase fet3 [Coemansia sp. RSA 2320]
MANVDGTHERMVAVVNGQLELPLAEAELGDMLAFRIRNGLKDEPTGLHSHGLFNNGTNYYDGAGMITECGVAPGSELTYEIPITQTGTYWLHGHHNAQYINGLRWPLIVTDPNGEPYEYDEDVVLAFEDWFYNASSMKMEKVIHKGDNMLRRDLSSTTCTDSNSPAASSAAPSSLPNRKMDMGCEGNNCTAAATATAAAPSDKNTDPAKKYPIGLVNRRSGKDPVHLYFEPGKTYRLRLLNIGSTCMFRFGIEGHDMHVIEVDGVATEKKKVNSVMLGVAQRVSVLVTARPDKSKNYRYHYDIFTDVFPQYPGYNPKEYSGSVVYDESAELAPRTDITWEEFDDLSLVPLNREPILEPNVIHDAVITVNRTSAEMVQAYINGVSFELPETPSIFTALSSPNTRALNSSSFGEKTNAKVLQYMDIVELRVANYDTVHHPMHLHGQFFQIAERGTIGDPSSAVKSSSTPMSRDTILVPPNSYAYLRFRADNPGAWLCHCHIELHMELGLSMMFVTAPDVMQKEMRMPEAMVEQCRLMGMQI